MKITWGKLGSRWPIECQGDITAYVDGASSVLDAHQTVLTLADRLITSPGRVGLDALRAGEVAAAIYANVVFVRACTGPRSSDR